MYRSTKLKITDLNPHLVCTLCGGYFIDATTIIECLHSFCRSCIVKYLENNKFCPVCEVQVHKTRPLLNIRSDQTLQDIVYKLVPGLYKNEMSLRREFYAKHTEAVPTNPEDRGETLEKFVYSPDETISLSLEYTADSAYKDQDQALENANSRSRRFLRCPAAVTVALLKKLVRGKFGLLPSHPLDLIFGEDTLSDEYSLVDIAYIYLWRRKGPMNLKYRIYETVTSTSETHKNETIKSESIEIDSVIAKNNNEEKDVDTGSQSLQSKDLALSPKSIKCSVPEKAAAESDADSATEPWKEVQLKISESGVMSVLNVEVCLPPSSNASDSDVLATVLSSGKSKDVRSNEDPGTNSAKGNRDTKKSTSGKASQASHGIELASKKQISAPLSGTLKTSKAQPKPTNLSNSRVAATNHAPNSASTPVAVKRTFSAMESSAPSSLPNTSASSSPISQPSAPKAPRFFKARNANAQPQSKLAHTYQSTFSSTAKNKDKNKANKANKLPAFEVSKSVEPPLLPKELRPVTTPTTCQAPTSVTHSLSQETTPEMNANTLPRPSGDLLPAKPKDLVISGGKETPLKNDNATKAKHKVEVTSETKKVAPQHVELVIPKVPEVFNLCTTPCTSATESLTSKTSRPPTPLYSSASQSLTNANISTSRASSPSIPRPSSAPAVPKPGQRRPMITRPLTPGPLSLTANGKSAKPVETSLSSDSRGAEPAKTAQSPLSSPVATNCSPLIPAIHGWLSPPLPGTSRSSTNLGKPPASPSLVAPQSPSHLSALQQHHALTRSSLSFLPRGPLPAHLFPNFIHPPHLPYVPSASHLHLSQASLNTVGKLGNIGEVATSSNATMTAAPPSSNANQTSPKSGANSAVASNSGTNLLPSTTSVAWSAISRPQASPSHYSLSSLMATPVMSLPDHLGLTSFAKSLNTALLSPLSREAQNQQRIMEALTGSLFNFSATYPELLQASNAATALPKTDTKLKATRPSDNLASRPSMTSPLTHPYFGYGYHSSLPPTVTTLANIRSHDLRSTTSTTTPVTSTKPLASRRPPPLVPLNKKSQSATAAQKDALSRQDNSNKNLAATVSSPTLSQEEKNPEEKTTSRENCANDLSSQSKREETDRTKPSQGEGSGTDVLTGGVSLKSESGINGEVAKDAEKVSGVEDLSGCNGAARDGSAGKVPKLPSKEGSTSETSAD